MHIKQIIFQNFRNFKILELPLNPGFVVLSGPNGTGKTNFLEGIYWAAMLKRFPGSKLPQLVRDNEAFYKVHLQFQSEDEETLELVCEKREEKYQFQYKYNNLAATRAKYTGHLPIISFLPEDLNLLSHSPAGRRRFLDEALSAVSAEYRHNLSQYEKTLRQRNEALQTNGELEIWNEQLAEYGSLIIAERQKFLHFIQDNLSAIADKLSKELAGSKVEYQFSGSADKKEFLAQIQRQADKEKTAGTTLIGPHRDDFLILNNNAAIVGYLSRGQMRAITLALKFLERKFLLERLKQTPIMLLDDVFSEFDETHQRALIDFLQTFDQVFLTTAHLKEVQAFLPANSQVYNVINGGIIPSPSPHFPPLEEGLREG